KVRIAPIHAKIHYFVCDAGGACAAIELLGGKLVITHGDAMPVCAITNSPYAEAKASLASTKASQTSFGRFKKIADALPSASDAWKILDDVRFESSTQWQVVYEPAARRFAFRTLAHRAKKAVSLAAFDFRCGAPALAHTMQTDLAGDVSARFVPFGE